MLNFRSSDLSKPLVAGRSDSWPRRGTSAVRGLALRIARAELGGRPPVITGPEGTAGIAMLGGGGDGGGFERAGYSTDLNNEPRWAFANLTSSLESQRLFLVSRALHVPS